jgi:hypothetical protein
LIFLDTFWKKNIQIPDVRAELFHAEERTDRRTDRYDEVNNGFRDIAMARKNGEMKV